MKTQTNESIRVISDMSATVDGVCLSTCLISKTAQWTPIIFRIYFHTCVVYLFVVDLTALFNNKVYIASN